MHFRPGIGRSARCCRSPSIDLDLRNWKLASLSHRAEITRPPASLIPSLPPLNYTSLVNTDPYILGIGQSSAGGEGRPALEVKEGLPEGVMFGLKSEGWAGITRVKSEGDSGSGNGNGILP